MKFIIAFFSILTLNLSKGYTQENTIYGPEIKINSHKNIELLGFAYFLGFEGEGIESKTIEIDKKTVSKKDWHNYGYQFYKKYEQYVHSKHLQSAFSVADHLWLDRIIYLLLQVDPVPNAKISNEIPIEAYLPFSKNGDPSEALQNVNQFLDGLNKFSLEIDFDTFLNQTKPYYDKAFEEVKSTLIGRNYVDELERYFNKEFSSYNLMPSLTLPKGMGFGIKIRQNVFSVVAANDWQSFYDHNNLQMGFTNEQKLKELSVHEFAHSFVNPKVAQLPDSLFIVTQSLFKPIKTTITSQGYNTWKACIYEHFTRATELILAEKYDTPENYKFLSKEYITERKFIYLPLILKTLKATKASGASFEQGLLNSMQELLNLIDDQENCEVNIHTEDITRFWEIYDQSQGRVHKKILQEDYLDKGSKGLKSFIPMRIESAKKLAKTLKKEKSYYKAIRSATLNLTKEKEEICEIYARLDTLYEKAQFPNIYFVIGRKNSGGTASNDGIIIGVEKFGTAYKNFKPDIEKKELINLIAHELIHYQQNYPSDNSLLAQSIKEGAADFLSDLLLRSSYYPTKEHYKFGDENEDRLKIEFKEQMNKKNWNGWLYYTKGKDRPKDLGYWIGYKICQSFYNKQMDKKQAIHNILNIRDFDAFLKNSGYYTIN